VTPENAALIVAQTGVAELHGTFRSRFDSPAEWRPEWADYGVWHADEEKIKKVIGI
jgi:copper homeostasis protein CutC